MGDVETVEATRDRGVGITVYWLTPRAAPVAPICAKPAWQRRWRRPVRLPKHTEADPASGLADAALMAQTLREFDSWHPAAFDADRAIDLALACEAAGRAVDVRIGNSDGASVNANASISVYANSHGFLGTERSTSYSAGCALIAGEGEAMQRDGWFSVALAQDDLETPEAIGRKAAQRYLYNGSIPGRCPPIRCRCCLRGNGALVDWQLHWCGLWRRVVPARQLPAGQRRHACSRTGLRLKKTPLCCAASAPASFDGEGVATRKSMLVDAGIVQRYVLGSYSARKLGLATTANAGGVHNLQVRPMPAIWPRKSRRWGVACW